MKKGSRMLLLLAVFLFCAVVFPVDAQAETVSSGKCGDNVTWTLDDAGTLTISGTGEMYNYELGEAPMEWGTARKVIFEEGVTAICSEPFYTFEDEISIEISASVTKIWGSPYGTFPGSSLAGIWVNENNPVYSNDEKGVLYDDVKAVLVRAPTNLSGSYTIRTNTKTIDDCAFNACKNLTNVTIPNSVKTICMAAFQDCDGLTSVTIPDSVTEIWEGAFNLCDNLKSVKLSKKVTVICPYVFQCCTSLINIEIPSGVTAICESAFSGCTSLKSVTIPESVTEIEWYAFERCTSLTDVYYAGSPKQWAKIKINNDEECNEPLLNAKITFGKCDHNYNSGVVTKKATCKEEGVKTFTCSICKGTRTEKIAKLTTHSYDDGVITTDPTCKEEGVKTFTCTVCAKSYTEKIEKLTEHSYDDGVITTPPTCKDTGIMTFTCTICEDSFTEDAPKLTTHTYDEGVVTKASTCKEEGIKTFTCTVCDVKKTEPIEKTDVHTYAGGVCAICGSSDPNYAPIVDEPEPDDPVNDTQKIVVIAVVAVSIVLIGAVCLFFFFSRDKDSDDSHS